MIPRKVTQVARILRKRDTWAERLLWSWIRDRRFSAYKFRRQHPYPPYVLDFFCLEARLNIGQHGLDHQRNQDTDRDATLEARGIKVLRFWNGRLRREKQFVRDLIWRTLQERAPLEIPGDEREH